MRNAFLCCFLITSAFGQDPASDEGLLPVFRCVLDERPRMLVILLGEKQDQALAFHTESGTLWKAWKAEEGKPAVLLVGALYTGKHGPQPESQGKLLFTDEKPQLSCSDPEASLQYLGHLVGKDGAVSVRWAFQDASHHNLAVIKASAAPGTAGVDLNYQLEAPPAGGRQVSIRKPGSADASRDLKAGMPVDFNIDFAK